MPHSVIVHEENGKVHGKVGSRGVGAIPFGTPHPFASPLTISNFKELRFHLEDHTNPASGENAACGGNGELGDPGAWGVALYNAIFGHDPKSTEAYRRLRFAIESRRPIHVVVRSNDPQFLSLPWELTKLPGATDPIAARADIFDRSLLESGSPQLLATTADGFRVLMVIARPRCIGDMSLQTVARPLYQHLQTAKNAVRMDVLRPPSFDAFRKRLKDAKDAGTPYHAVHFDGHCMLGRMEAVLNPDSQLNAEPSQAYAVFERDAGSAEPVAALAFAEALVAGDVPLVILNACQSREIETADDAACPEAAVAAQLLRSGLASVVTMSYLLNCAVTAAFMAAFYEQLLAGKNVSEAVGIARKALRLENTRPGPKDSMAVQDWIVPVHYTRSALRLRQRETMPGPLAEGTVAKGMGVAKAGDVPARGDLAAADNMFFGRDAEFLTLESAMRTHRIALLHGVGGGGKTELAKAFAHWLQVSSGFEGPLFVFYRSFEPGQPPFGIDTIANEIMARFGEAQAYFAAGSAKRRAELLLQLLCRHRCLLIWDHFCNVASMTDPGKGAPALDETNKAALLWLLSEFRKTRSAVLIASRSNEDWLGGPETIVRCEVSGFNGRDVQLYADCLLAPHPQAKTRRAADPVSFKALIDHLGGHPLSLKLVLPQLNEMSAAALLDGLKGQRTLPAKLSAAGGHLESLGASISYSLRRLSEKDQGRLVILSLFERVVSANTLGAMKDGPARFQDFGGQAWDALLGQLADIGLMESLGSGLYQLHPALPPYLTALWQSQTEATGDWAAEREAALRCLVGAAASVGGNLRWQIEEGEVLDALARTTAYRASLRTFLAAALERSLFAEAQPLMHALNEYWESAALSLEAQAWSERVIKATEPAPGQAPESGTPAFDLWLSVISNEANHAFQAGDLDKAEGLYRRIGCRQVTCHSRMQRRGSGCACCKLCLVEQERGRLDEADGWAKKYLAIAEASGDPLDCAFSYHQLGVVAQLRGDSAEAENWYKKSVAIHNTLLNQPQMAVTYQQLSQEAAQGGRHDEAHTWNQKFIEIEGALGKMADGYHRLGFLAQGHGRPGEAEGWYCKALSISEALSNQPSMSQNYRQLGIVAQQRGQFGKAEEWYRKLVTTEEALGNQPEMAQAYRLAGAAMRERSHLQEAGTWYKKSLAIEEALGSKPGIAATCFQLGLLSRDLGFLRDAESWAMRAFAIFDMLGDEPNKGQALTLIVQLKAISGENKSTEEDKPKPSIWAKLRGNFTQSGARANMA